MSAASGPAGFREPQQARSRRTLARIAEATESLLLEPGGEEITVRGVVERADTSVGAFYTRFRSRDDAVAYVHDRFWEDVRSRWSDFLDPDRWRGVGAASLVAEVVRRYVRVSLSNRRSRAFLLELLGRSDASLLERVRGLDAEIAAMMGRLVEERASELAHPRPAEAGREGFRRVLSAVRDHLLFGEVDSRIANERLILSLTQMLGGMLGVPERAGSYPELARLCARVVVR